MAGGDAVGAGVPPATTDNMTQKYWSEAEKGLLSTLMYRYSIEDVARKLDRTTVAVALAIARHIKPVEYNVTETAQLLGVIRPQVQEWIKAGFFSHYRKTSDGRQQSSMRYYRIHQSSLIAFVMDPVFGFKIKPTGWLKSYQAQHLEFYVDARWIAARYPIDTTSVGSWFKRGIIPALKTPYRFRQIGAIWYTPRIVAEDHIRLMCDGWLPSQCKPCNHQLAYELGKHKLPTEDGPKYWEDYHQARVPGRKRWNWPAPGRFLS